MLIVAVGFHRPCNTRLVIAIGIIKTNFLVVGIDVSISSTATRHDSILISPTSYSHNLFLRDSS